MSCREVTATGRELAVLGLRRPAQHRRRRLGRVRSFAERGIGTAILRMRMLNSDVGLPGVVFRKLNFKWKSLNLDIMEVYSIRTIATPHLRECVPHSLHSSFVIYYGIRIVFSVLKKVNFKWKSVKWSAQIYTLSVEVCHIRSFAVFHIPRNEIGPHCLYVFHTSSLECAQVPSLDTTRSLKVRIRTHLVTLLWIR